MQANSYGYLAVLSDALGDKDANLKINNLALLLFREVGDKTDEALAFV